MTGGPPPEQLKTSGEASAGLKPFFINWLVARLEDELNSGGVPGRCGPPSAGQASNDSSDGLVRIPIGMVEGLLCPDRA